VISGGCVLSGGVVINSVLGRGVRVQSRALVEDSVVFDDCDIGSGARIRRAIVDANTCAPSDTTIGHDIERDRQRYQVSESGIVVVEGGRRCETDCQESS